MAKDNDHKLAKRLACLVLDKGEEGIAQLRPALERILQSRSNADRKSFLKAFHKAVVLELHRDSLRIQSAAPLSEAERDKIVTIFQSEGARKLQVTTEVEPELLGGIRVQMGDTVMDASLSYSLRALAANIR
jgi:F0F1-type ATP synthase delta subunit